MMVSPERAATCGAASAESVERPIAGLPAASAMPRAAEMPTRRPVKLPGPTVTAMRLRSANSQRRRVHHARDQRHHGFGVAARHGERFAGQDRATLRIEHGGRAGAERGIDGENAHEPAPAVTGARSELAHDP